ncbi:sulfotransferase family protein [Halomonas urmiana]|uniref:Sulfotransferase family protein n=1 Tax=Halomonas urmiana TaxID=490901 RepID=A0A5R8MCM3_9GAMM|nr:sulfotransferase family 2 domain-containing protein [Halomonas urmiana]TLF47250.1 sulfotransferase family protein [Halomonas urmiana]
MNIHEVEKRKRSGDFQNNTNISLVNKYVYFAVDKAANSTVKHCLFEIEYRPVNKTILDIYDPRASPLLSPYQIPQDYFSSIMSGKDFYKFSFVRNPYSRLLSCYLDRIQTRTSRPSREFRKALGRETFTFSDFVTLVCSQASKAQNSHWREQSDDILFDLVDFDHIAKFENLWDEMEFLSKKIFGDVREEMVNKSVNSSPKQTGSDSKLLEYYDQYLLDMVYDRYSKDFENFGYEKVVI